MIWHAYKNDTAACEPTTFAEFARIPARYQAYHLTYQLKISSVDFWMAEQSEIQILNPVLYTANMCSGIAMEVHLKNCNFEKIQFSTVDLGSLYFLQVKNCNFSIIFMYSILHRIECSYYKFSLYFKNTTKKL